MRDANTPSLTSLRWPLRLTRWGLFAEQIVRAFWPLWTILLIAAATIGFELTQYLSSDLLWAALGASGLATLVALGYGIRSFIWPTKADAMERLDLSMPGRPITAALDSQAIGDGDAASQAVWQAHKARMEARLSEAEAVSPDLRVSDRDPYALRYAALLLFAIALGFGSLLRGGGLNDLNMSARGDTLATGPSWEIWIEPPAYTGKPGLYLNDIKLAKLDVPMGSLLTARLYGEVGKLSLVESVSGQAETAALQPSVSFEIVQSGNLRVEGADDAEWDIAIVADAPPIVTVDAEIERSVQGEMKLPFTAADDYGVETGSAEITLDLANADRRYGLIVDPEPRDSVVLDLPMPFNGARDQFDEVLIENLSEHPWAGLPVQFSLQVSDASEQVSEPVTLNVTLPGRRFFQPIAKAVVEQRRDILWSRDNVGRVGQVLRTITHDPEGFWPNEQAYLTIRRALTRMELAQEYDGFTPEKRDEIAGMLWRAAVLLEDGRLSDALERLRRAQERLSEAMENGANDEEIAELMQELREAMQQYMQQLAQEGQQQDQQQAENQQSQEITGQELQDMLDRIQELMEQGRMEEAEQLLAELMEMMQNMQAAEGGSGGEGQQGEGQQAMEGLQDTLRQQQGLSDEAFRNLQEQFNPGAQAGESQGNTGRNGGQGQGQSHEGEGGQGQAQNEGSGEGDGDGRSPSPGAWEPGMLADRQQALRDELNRQAQNLPGQGTPEGDAARDALERADDAMDRAEDALRQDRMADALGAQSDAMEALREGMRNLGEAMAQQQQNGQQGSSDGQFSDQGRDPLGRESGDGGFAGSERDGLVPGEGRSVRSRKLRDEIRRRSSEKDRPQVELDYLERLLDRF